MTQQTQTSALRKATRQKAKIKLGLSSVSGGGKTYSAILLGKGLAKGDLSKVAIIDTENNSADLYAHLGPYNVLPLHPPFSPERYIESIKECENAGMEVIIIDSIAHEWEGEGGILNLCDTIGGGFTDAWKKMTPRHEKFKNAILQSPCHIITTVRRKQEYILEERTNKQGRTVQVPVKAGMKEITREGWEYEVTANLEIDIKHYASATKDRTNLFTNIDPFIISEETGRKILEWCESGVEVIQGPSPKDSAIQRLKDSKDIKELATQYNTLSNELKKDADIMKLKEERKSELTPQTV